MNAIIKWLVELEPNKMILAILLIATSVLWGLSLSDKAELKEINKVQLAQIITAKQEVVDCKAHEAELLKELLYNVAKIEQKSEAIDSAYKIVEKVAITNNQKIKKLLKNDKSIK